MENKVAYFDLFDTLVKVDRGYLEPYFDRETDRLGDNGTLKNADMTIDRILNNAPANQRLLEGKTPYQMARDYEGFMKHSLDNPPEGVLKMLEQLKNEGYKLCVISDAAYVDIAAWDTSPLAQYFDNTVFSCDVKLIKPDPALFQHALNVMGNPEHSLFIGDGGHEELMGAQRAGMITVKAEWLNNRRVDEIYKHSNIKTPDPTLVPEMVRDIDYNQVMTHNAAMISIRQIADGQEPIMPIDELMDWVTKNQEEVQQAIDNKEISIDEFGEVIKQQYDISLDIQDKDIEEVIEQKR